MRLIDADRLLTDRMKSKYYHLPNGDIAIPLIDIEHAPTIEPERKNGHWILSDYQVKEDTDNGNYRYYCSNCSHADIHARTVDVPYCWYCGAKMEEGEK